MSARSLDTPATPITDTPPERRLLTLPGCVVIMITKCECHGASSFQRHGVVGSMAWSCRRYLVCDEP